MSARLECTDALSNHQESNHEPANPIDLDTRCFKHQYLSLKAIGAMTALVKIVKVPKDRSSINLERVGTVPVVRFLRHFTAHRIHVLQIYICEFSCLKVLTLLRAVQQPLLAMCGTQKIRDRTTQLQLWRVAGQSSEPLNLIVSNKSCLQEIPTSNHGAINEAIETVVVRLCEVWLRLLQWWQLLQKEHHTSITLVSRVITHSSSTYKDLIKIQVNHANSHTEIT
jgi:hypothetical protein